MDWRNINTTTLSEDPIVYKFIRISNEPRDWHETVLMLRCVSTISNFMFSVNEAVEIHSLVNIISLL